MKALSGRILIKLIEADKETESGLAIINTKEKPMKARVLDCGADIVYSKRTVKSPCETGDIIYIKDNSVQSLSGISSASMQRRGEGRVYFSDVVGIEKEGEVCAVFDNVIVEIKYDEKVGSIIIPETAKKHHSDFHSIVISKGPDNKDDVTVGDEIIIERHEGFVIKKDNRTMVSLTPKRTLAVID